MLWPRRPLQEAIGVMRGDKSPIIFWSVGDYSDTTQAEGLTSSPEAYRFIPHLVTYDAAKGWKITATDWKARHALIFFSSVNIPLLLSTDSLGKPSMLLSQEGPHSCAYYTAFRTIQGQNTWRKGQINSTGDWLEEVWYFIWSFHLIYPGTNSQVGSFLVLKGIMNEAQKKWKSGIQSGQEK